MVMIGSFLLTFDTELAWGTNNDPRYTEQYRRTRSCIARLLLLLECYEIPATWAIVGQLFFKDSYEASLFGVDVGDHLDPELWYGKDIVDLILSHPRHEIGSHTFSHTIASTVSRDVFKHDLEQAIEAGRRAGIKISSLVYPCNDVAHTDVVSNVGIRVYRDRDDCWYTYLSGIAKRVAHVIDQYCVPSSRSVTVSRQSNIVSIPGSYFYVHKSGWAHWLPVSFRVRKIKHGIDRAIARGELFHLWTHPFNIASDDRLLDGLEEVFRYVADARSKGCIRTITMRDCASLA